MGFSYPVFIYCTGAKQFKTRKRNHILHDWSYGKGFIAWNEIINWCI